MRRNTDKMLLESLVRKYGKNTILKAVNEGANISKKPFREILLKPNQYVISFNGKSADFYYDNNKAIAGVLYTTNDIKQTIQILNDEYGWFDYDADLNNLINGIENARSWRPFEFDIDEYITLVGYKCV